MSWYEIVGIIAVILGIGEFVFNFRDRIIKWKRKRKKGKQKQSKNIKHIVNNNDQENHPNFEFTLGYISNSQPGNCQLSIGLKNLSNSVKFIEMADYHFQFIDFPQRYLPPGSIINREKWPKRLEHGERFHLSIAFESFLNNHLYDYWKNGVRVFVRCKSSTGDLLQTNAIGFDKLAERLVPISQDYHNLAVSLSDSFGCSLRDIESSLWQLQIFSRLTSHIARQFALCNIPIADYLKNKHNLVVQNNAWNLTNKPLEQKKIPPLEIIDFLKGL